MATKTVPARTRRESYSMPETGCDEEPEEPTAVISAMRSGQSIWMIVVRQNDASCDVVGSGRLGKLRVQGDQVSEEKTADPSTACGRSGWQPFIDRSGLRFSSRWELWCRGLGLVGGQCRCRSPQPAILRLRPSVQRCEWEGRRVRARPASCHR